MRRFLLATATLLTCCMSVATQARAATTTVSALTDIFLASQPDSTTITGFFGSDSAPTNSPVAIGVTGGARLTFAASGSTSVDGNCFAGPDGGCYSDQSSFSPSPASGTYNGPADALIGVFLPSGVTSVADGPASLNYQNPANFSQTSYFPALNQIFFIGDGLTGTGGGTVQQFAAPVGATTLYLAVADSYGSSTGDLGSLSVDYIVGPPAPEPATWAMMLIGFGGLGAAMRRSRRIAVPA